METRYIIDVDLPGSGLASLELVTELYASISTDLIIVCQGLMARTPILRNDMLPDLIFFFGDSGSIL